MKNYKLDTTLLPEVWLYWKTVKDGDIYMNPNGKRQHNREPWMGSTTSKDAVGIGIHYYSRNRTKIWVGAGSNVMFGYAKYHRDIDRLELAAVKYDTTRGEHKHEWSFAGNRFFVGKDKSVIDQNGNKCTTFNVRYGCIYGRAKDMVASILRLTTNDKFIAEFKKFIGADYFTIGNGTTVSITSGYSLSKWFESVQKTRKPSATQAFVDKLSAMPLGDIVDLADKYPTKVIQKTYGEYTISNIIYYERVNPEWSVLRALYRDNHNQLNEVWRVYLGDDGTNRIMSKSESGWIPSSQPNSWYNRSGFYFANYSEAVEKCNRIKYIAPMVDEETEDIHPMITTLRFPIIEQMYKMGYDKMAKNIANSHTPNADVKRMFGGYYKDKESSLLRQVGMTKHQLDQYYDLCRSDRGYYYNHGEVLQKMRTIFGDDLSHIDNVTYDNYLAALDAFMNQFYSYHNIANLDIDEGQFLRNIIRIGKKDSATYRLASDTLSLYRRLNNPRPNVDWMFDSYSDIVRLHDALNALVTEQEAERRALYNMAEADRRKKEDEYRKKVDEERKCYEYEDENFIIRLPHSVQEIVNEGTTQRICIGGYTTRHSKGETNLFFLRKKIDEDKPFYAIEMNNDKHIVQIHGFGNKWLGNDADAIPTVIRWLRKHGIKCDDKILTCKATGYGARNDYVPMPVVD